MSMTPEAKRELSNTIRALRERLLADLHDATESVYRLAVHEREAGLSDDGSQWFISLVRDRVAGFRSAGFRS